MRRLISVLGVCLVGGLLLVGCVTQYTPVKLEQPEVGGVMASTREPPLDETWISPAKVTIGKFYPGARAEWELQIHNGNDYEATFAVSYKYPDNVGDGYIKPPLGTQDWVVVADTLPIIASRETRNILVVLDMPRDTKSFGSNWEFWVSVQDKSQKGMVRTELCERILVTMRE